MPSPTNITLAHRDIRAETTAHVPLHLVHPWKDAVAHALHSSHHARDTIPVVGTNLAVFGCLQRIPDGNCYFLVAANPPEDNGGKITIGTILYRGMVSVRLATAPLTWRWLIQSYVEALLDAPPFQPFSAPGLMPQKMPLFCGFATTATRHLPSEERNAVIVTARLAALLLLPKCEAGARETEDAGKFPNPNPAFYPELLSWEG